MRKRLLRSYNSSHSVCITSVNLRSNRKQCKQPEMTASNQQYDLMLTLRNAFSIFISNGDVMYLSDIKSNSKTVQVTSIGHKRPAMLSI